MERTSKVGNLIEFVRTNAQEIYDRLEKLSWQEKFAEKISVLSKNSHYDREELMQSTWTNIFRTLTYYQKKYDWLQENDPTALKALLKSKAIWIPIKQMKKGSVKQLEAIEEYERRCNLPVTHPEYLEDARTNKAKLIMFKDKTTFLNNYVALSLNQNIDMKLKKLHEVAYLDESLGEKEFCLLDTLKADTDIESAILNKLNSEMLLDLKIVFKTPLDANENIVPHNYKTTDIFVCKQSDRVCKLPYYMYHEIDAFKLLEDFSYYKGYKPSTSLQEGSKKPNRAYKDYDFLEYSSYSEYKMAPTIRKYSQLDEEATTLQDIYSINYYSDNHPDYQIKHALSYEDTETEIPWTQEEYQAIFKGLVSMYKDYPEYYFDLTPNFVKKIKETFKAYIMQLTEEITTYNAQGKEVAETRPIYALEIKEISTKEAALESLTTKDKQAYMNKVLNAIEVYKRSGASDQESYQQLYNIDSALPFKVMSATTERSLKTILKKVIPDKKTIYREKKMLITSI